jgi:hypothetical protein
MVEQSRSPTIQPYFSNNWYPMSLAAIDRAMQAARRHDPASQASTWPYPWGLRDTRRRKRQAASRGLRGSREWERRAIEANPNFALAHFFLAAALGQFGRQDEARAEVKAGLTINPDFTIAHFRAETPCENATCLADGGDAP